MEQTKYHMIPRTPSEDELKNIFASMTLSTQKVVKTPQKTSCNVLKTGKMNNIDYAQRFTNVE